MYTNDTTPLDPHINPLFNANFIWQAGHCKLHTENFTQALCLHIEKLPTNSVVHIKHSFEWYIETNYATIDPDNLSVIYYWVQLQRHKTCETN